MFFVAIPLYVLCFLLPMGNFRSPGYFMNGITGNLRNTFS